MTTFDPAGVGNFAAALGARMNACDNGEGMECMNIDESLQQYAIICCEFTERCRQWGRAIFNGQVAFDPEVERIWLDEGLRMHARASELWAHGQEFAGERFVLEGGAALGAAVWRLERLLNGWVTPKLAVSPLARHGAALTDEDKKEFQRRVNALPGLRHA